MNLARPRPADSVLSLVSGLPSNLREKQWMLTIQAFIDDSGSDGQSPAYVLAGFLATAGKWSKFTDVWVDKLKAGNLDYCKMNEAMHLKGQFESGWTLPLRDQKILELADVIAEHASLKIGVSLHTQTYNEFVAELAPALEYRDPYFLCYYVLIHRLNTFLMHLGEEVDCDVIFDEQGAIGANAAFWFDRMKELSAEMGRPLLINRPYFRDDKKFRPLQAADMFAWFARRRTAKEPDVNVQKAVLRSWSEIQDINRKIDREYLMNMGAGFVITNAKLAGVLPDEF